MRVLKSIIYAPHPSPLPMGEGIIRDAFLGCCNVGIQEQMVSYSFAKHKVIVHVPLAPLKAELHKIFQGLLL